MKKSNTAICFACDEPKLNISVVQWGKSLHVVCKDCQEAAK